MRNCSLKSSMGSFEPKKFGFVWRNSKPLKALKISGHQRANQAVVMNSPKDAVPDSFLLIWTILIV